MRKAAYQRRYRQRHPEEHAARRLSEQLAEARSRPPEEARPPPSLGDPLDRMPWEPIGEALCESEETAVIGLQMALAILVRWVGRPDPLRTTDRPPP